MCFDESEYLKGETSLFNPAKEVREDTRPVNTVSTEGFVSYTKRLPEPIRSITAFFKIPISYILHTSEDIALGLCVITDNTVRIASCYR